MSEPLTRQEQLLSAIATGGDIISPVTREEMYLTYMAGDASYHLKPTTQPTLYSTNAFNNIPSDCIIYVPKGCLEAYQNATNWATYADRMQEDVPELFA